MAKSVYSRVNGRGHRTLSDKARCQECGRVYIDWKFIGRDLKCFMCHGVDEQNTEALIKFIAENRQKKEGVTSMKATTSIQEARQAVQQGKAVKVKQDWRDVQVISLTPGLYGTGDQMCWTHFSVEVAQYTDLMGNETFTIYE